MRKKKRLYDATKKKKIKESTPLVIALYKKCSFVFEKCFFIYNSAQDLNKENIGQSH